MRHIYFIERNIHGGYTIYGTIGVKQYYGYNKSECKKMYNEQAHSELFFNVRHL